MIPDDNVDIGGDFNLPSQNISQQGRQQANRNDNGRQGSQHIPTYKDQCRAAPGEGIATNQPPVPRVAPNIARRSNDAARLPATSSVPDFKGQVRNAGTGEAQGGPERNLPGNKVRKVPSTQASLQSAHAEQVDAASSSISQRTPVAHAVNQGATQAAHVTENNVATSRNDNPSFADAVLIDNSTTVDRDDEETEERISS